LPQQEMAKVNQRFI